MMKKNVNLLKVFPIILIIIVVVVVVAAWSIPVWQADLSLDIQLYSGKVLGGAHGVDFIQVNYLNWAKLWAPLIPAAIITGITFYPRKFLRILTAHSAHKSRIVILFSCIVFGASYGICYLDSDFAYGFFMANYMQNDPTYVNFFASFAAMAIPFDPSKYNVGGVDAILTWKYLTMPILNAILTGFLIRLILEMIGARVAGGYAIEFLGRLFLVIGIILVYAYFATPLSTYDVIERMWLYILPLTMWTFLSIGSFGLLFATFAKNSRDREEVAGATFIVAIIIVIGMIIGPCIAAAGDYLGRDLHYEQLVWDGKVQMQNSQTRIGSGINGFQRQNITTLLNIPTNPQIVSKIRPFNQNSSMQTLEAHINTAYETGHLPDILLLNNTEYWVTTRDFYEGAPAFGNAINQHVRYTSTQGFVAMDAHTGIVIDPTQYPSIFGVNYTNPFYFGEGFRSDLMLGLSAWPEINATSANTTFPISKADGHLSGYLTSVKVLGMSTDFLTLANQNISFLHRTNIVDRVSGMLLPNMYMDSDPYLVFDKLSHVVYYCCPVYISIPSFTYFQSDYIRFLGWVLVDVHYGTMQFYLYPGLDTNSLISYARIYVDKNIYPWQTSIPDWLKSQLRYPESVYKQQLAVDYIYHVTDVIPWHDNSNFYAEPPGSDTYFVMMDLGNGNGLELVTMSLVVPTSDTTTLAGMYIQQHYFSKLGNVTFYKTVPGHTLIGPETAEQYFYNFHGISQNLTLVPGRVTGNILLYCFANTLYYVVPVYSTSSKGLNTLNYVGLVNGSNPADIHWGTTPEQAFATINTTHVTPPPPIIQQASSVSLTCTSPPSVTALSPANISLLMKNTNTNLTASPVAFTANLTVYSQNTTLYINGTKVTGAGNVTSFSNDVKYSSLGAGTNYTIGSWQLYSSQSRGLTVQLNATLGNFTTMTVPFRFVIKYANGTTFSTGLRTVTFNTPGYASRNITGPGVVLGFNIPSAVSGSTITTFGLNVTNVNTNMSAPAKHIQVILTLFAMTPVNATPQVPGKQTISNVSFQSDIMYPGHKGSNYTVIDMNLASQAFFGITMAINLPGTRPATLVYRVALVVDGIPAGTTLLRVMTWT